MKKGLLIILTLIIGFGLGWWFNELNPLPEGVVEDARNIKPNTGDLNLTLEREKLTTEDFETFFYQFMYDPDFQISRIKFPLPFIYFKDGDPGDETDTTFLTKEKWEHNHYFLNETSIPVIYDNYEMKLRNTEERVFVWSGVENGIYVTSYFKRINGKWFLIRKEDFST
ncbi:MAG: DUF4348 domain-containing protein [Bacteroidia bacterium]